MSPFRLGAAWRGALLFLLVGLVWIALSDQALMALAGGDLARYAALQTWKGAVFVFLTTALVFALLRGALRQQALAAQAIRLRDQRYARLIENLSVGIVHVDTAGEVLFVNDQAARMLGHDARSVAAHGWTVAVVERERPRIREQYAAAVRRGELFYAEFQVEHDDLAVIDLVAIGRPEHDEDDRLTGHVTSLTDVTELKRAHASLAQSEANFRALADDSLAGVFVSQGRQYVYVNDLMAHMLGRTKDQLLAMEDILELACAGDDRVRLHELAQQCEQGTSTSFRDVFRFRHGDDQPRVLEALCRRIEWNGAAAIIGTAIDRTEHERDHARLRASEARLRLFMDSNPALVWIVGNDGRCVYVNEAFARAFGRTREATIGSNVGDLVVGEDARRIAQRDVDLVARGEPIQVIERFTGHDGIQRTWETVRFPLPDGDGPPSMGAVAVDRSARARAESRLQDARERLRLAVDAGNVGLWEWYLPSRQAYYSGECKRQLGFTADELGNGLEEWNALVHPGDRATVRHFLRAMLHEPGRRCLCELRMQHKDGSWRWIMAQGRAQLDTAGKPARLRGVHVDITRLKSTEQALAESQLRINHLLQATPTVLYALRFGAQGLEPEWISDSITRILGYERDEALDPDWWVDHVHPDDRARCLANTAKLGEREHFTHEYRFLHKNGDIVFVRDEQRMLRDADGQPLEVIGTWSDITGVNSALARSRLYGSAFENTHDAVLITDLDGTIIAVNQAACTTTGYAEAELLGSNPRLFKSGRQDIADYQAMWAQITANGRWRGELWNRRKDGEVYPQLTTISTVHDEQGRAVNYVSVGTDISRLKEIEAELRHLAHFDLLTGLPNRLLTTSRLEHALSRARRQHDNVGVLFIDLDDFKKINDALGHTRGDELLRAVAARLATRVREEDTLGRLGGDEFLVVLEHVVGPNSIAGVARDLAATLAAPFTLSSGHEVQAEASIGVSVFPDDAATAEDLMRAADTAMYEAKRDIGGSIRYFTAAMGAAASEQLELEAALRAGIGNDELRLYYQPKFSIDARRLVGAEALVRWQRSDGRMESPARFIPVAERTGLIGALGAWVIDAACRQQRAWLDAGLRAQPVAVNVSVHQFALMDLAAVTQQAVRASRLEPPLLGLEVTESAAMEQPERAIEVLGPMKYHGHAIYLDDFGTGFSNLAYLTQLPLDVLKIDASFVRAIGHSAQADSLVASVIALARGLGLGTIAEGVESEDQFDFLRERGCDQAQGFLLGKPLPADDYAALLAAHR